MKNSVFRKIFLHKMNWKNPCFTLLSIIKPVLPHLKKQRNKQRTINRSYFNTRTKGKNYGENINWYFQRIQNEGSLRNLPILGLRQSGNRLQRQKSIRNRCRRRLSPQLQLFRCQSPDRCTFKQLLSEMEKVGQSGLIFIRRYYHGCR